MRIWSRGRATALPPGWRGRLRAPGGRPSAGRPGPGGKRPFKGPVVPLTDRGRPYRRLVLFCLLLLCLAGMRRVLRSGRTPDPHADEDGPEAPLPPRAGGMRRFEARYRAARALVRFVPSARRQRRLQAKGNRTATARAVGSPSAYRQKARYTLPFVGEWIVMNGGPDVDTSHSWDLIAQRYAYDFAVADGSLRRWRPGTTGGRPEDYVCYGAAVLSPAEGVVAVARDGVRDAPGVGSGWIDPFAGDFRGNFVVIKHAGGEFSFLAHLAPGSLRVEAGERVGRGQQVASCGNSGHSTEPHLHFQVQDRADFFEAAGLPVVFEDLSIDGGTPAGASLPQTGQRVRQGAEPASRSVPHDESAPKIS